MERSWTDERIGDAFRSVWERLGALDRTNERLATIDAVLPQLRAEVAAARAASVESIGECRSAIQTLADAFTARSVAREAERKAAAEERKKDRRFWITTALAFCTLVVGATVGLISVLGSAAG